MALTLAGGGEIDHTLSAGNQGNKEALYFDGKPISQEIINIIYPIGSIYMSLNNINPSTMFGGSWQELTGSYIKLGGSGEQANACATACHVTVATYGLNPCPTNCNKLVSNSDIYNGGASCSGTYNSNGYYEPNVNKHSNSAIEGHCCVWQTYSRSCDYCYNTCYSGYASSDQGGQESITGYGVKRCWSERSCNNDINNGYYLCLNGCIGCVSCHSNTYYTCHSCNSACHSCNSSCNNCYSNCHGSVGESFNIMYVHMWKRVE